MNWKTATPEVKAPQTAKTGPVAGQLAMEASASTISLGIHTAMTPKGATIREKCHVSAGFR
jgi:hypothetical protein